MISEVFKFYYTVNMHPARLGPLSRDELSKGMSPEAVDKYLSLVKQLYNAFAFDVNTKFVPQSKEVLHQKCIERERIYNSLIKHLLRQDAISENAYSELYKAKPIEFNYIECPDIPEKYVSDTFDDFRLAFEQSILDNDVNVDMKNFYLRDRYGYNCRVRPEAEEKYFITRADLFLYHEQDALQMPIKEISYWEACHLLKQIQYDMESNAEEQVRLDADFCRQKKHQFSYIPSLRKSTYKTPKNIQEWYTIKRALNIEAEYLRFVEYEVKDIFENMRKPSDKIGSDTSLFVYKGKILCHQQNHHIVPATAVLYDEHDQEIQMDVEYCSLCNRYMLNYISFENYKEKYGVLIGKLKMIISNSAGGEFAMALESPLKLCGYNVSRTEGLTSATRQYILSKIIHDGIMSKIEVIHYLEHFINMNGSKKENALAVLKWQEDLEFVHRYDIRIQPKVYIASVKRY